MEPAAVVPDHWHRKLHRTTLRQESVLACRLAESLCARCNFAGHPDWVMGRRPANETVSAWSIGPTSHWIVVAPRRCSRCSRLAFLPRVVAGTARQSGRCRTA
jgi:hypothetical protein